MDETVLNEIADKCGSEGAHSPLRTLAVYAERRGMFRTSCKLWTKVKEPLNAINALIREGNSHAVASYAISSTSKSVYQRATQYLGNIDCQSLYIRSVIEELRGRHEL